MKLSFSKLFAILVLVVNFGACKSVQVNQHKDYRLFLDPSSGSSFHHLFTQLINDFNKNVGFNALRLVDTQAEANSLIVLTPGLKLRDEKLGWGQWMTEEVVEYQSPVVFHMGGKDKDIYYSMRVEFDENYISERMYSQDKIAQLNIRTLWCHEIGHGFQLNHVSEQTDVMYEYIDGDYKNFPKYFAQVRSFFAR